MLPVIDIVLIIILAGFVFYGLFFGLIRTIGNLAGLAAGIFFASKFYLQAFEWARDLFFGRDSLGKVVVFFVIFSLVNRLVCFAFAIIDRSFGLLSIIPFLKSINRLAGAVFGLALGGMILGLVLFAASRYAISWHFLGNFIAGSELAPRFISFAGILTPLLPEALKKIQSVIN